MFDVLTEWIARMAEEPDPSATSPSRKVAENSSREEKHSLGCYHLWLEHGGTTWNCWATLEIEGCFVAKEQWLGKRMTEEGMQDMSLC